jgi:hypothetical protein
MKRILLTAIATLAIATINAQSLLNSTYLQKRAEATKGKKLDSTAQAERSFNAFQSNPNFLSMVNNGVTLVPNIDIQLSSIKQDSQAAVSYTVKIFTGSASVDTVLQNNALRMLLPEASKFGVKFNSILPFRVGKLKNASLNLEANYLYKDFPLKKDSQIVGSYSANILHCKVGVEKILVEKMISAYYHFNYALVLTGVDNMKTLFNKSVNNYMFHEAGLKFFFDLNGNSGVASNNVLSVDLGFIPVNGEVFKLYNNTHDYIIPLVRIGYVKSIDN